LPGAEDLFQIVAVGEETMSTAMGHRSLESAMGSSFTALSCVVLP